MADQGSPYVAEGPGISATFLLSQWQMPQWKVQVSVPEEANRRLSTNCTYSWVENPFQKWNLRVRISGFTTLL